MTTQSHPVSEQSVVDPSHSHMLAHLGHQHSLNLDQYFTSLNKDRSDDSYLYHSCTCTKLTLWADGADGRERGDGAGRARTLASSCSPVLLPVFSSRLYPSNNEILHQSITHVYPSSPSIYLRDLCNSAHVTVRSE